MIIPIAFISDKNFIMQTGVAIYSLIKNKNENTKYDIFVIMAECNKEDEKKLRLVETDKDKITIINVSLDMYKDIKQLSHIPIACLLKFNLCDYIDQYDKFIYLDGDIYVRGDLSDLYKIELEDNYIGGVPSLDMVFDNKKLINAGVMLFNAKLMRKDGMSNLLMETRKSLGNSGSMDQQTFNQVCSDRMIFLPFEYNCIANKLLGIERKAFSIEKVNKLYNTSFKNNKELVNSALIIHYATGGKPWQYTYIKCADEWYQCYLESPYNTIKLNRQNSIQTHLKGVVKNFKRGGIHALYNRLVWYIKEFFGKNDKASWG